MKMQIGSELAGETISITAASTSQEFCIGVALQKIHGSECLTFTRNVLEHLTYIFGEINGCFSADLLLLQAEIGFS
jgi:hypothetical protein